MSLQIQQVLQQRYFIIGHIGQGGMGAVYKAQDNRLGNRLVAVKEFDPAQLPLVNRDIAQQAFQQEAAILAQLSHPGLTAVTDYFTENNNFYLVMEFVSGETLQQAWERAGRRFAEAQVVAWAQELCSVLNYLHTRQPPIIFRDLKPGNIMMQPNGSLKLIDFGIARHFTPGKTNDTVKFGTPGYAAPEQYGKKQTDTRSDIYALGVVTYQLLTGYDPTTTPFHLPPISQLAPHVSLSVNHAITQALELDPSKRPPTVQAFSQALESNQDTPFNTTNRLTEFERKMISVGVGILLLISIIVGMPMFFIANVPASTPTPIILETPTSPEPQMEISLQTVSRLKELAQTEGSLSAAWLSTSLGTDLLALGHSTGVQIYDVPDMNPISFITTTTPSILDFYKDEILLIGDQQGNIKLLNYIDTDEVKLFQLANKFLIDLAFYPQPVGFVALAPNALTFASLEPTTNFTNISTQIADIDFGPDYRWLASANSDGSVKLWDPNNQTIIKTLGNYDTAITAVAFSPDGMFLIAGDQNGNLYKWRMQDYSLEKVVKSHQGAVTAVDISSNGQIVVSSGKDGLVRFGSSLDLNLLRTVQLQPGYIEKVYFSPNGDWLVLQGDDNSVRIWGMP